MHFLRQIPVRSVIGRSFRVGLFALALLAAATTARAQSASACDMDGVQSSGSIYRICMPRSAYNGNLVIWAHGFQDAGTPVAIPEDQFLSELVNGLGFAFASNSYSKTGLAILQGQADILDLVNIFAAQKGQPRKVYLVGASEGGIITALSLEQSPGVFAAGTAACGPIGDFPFQVNYFGDARATFEYFFPGLIPGDPFHPDPQLVATWTDFYETVVAPVVFDPANRHLLDQWAAAAKLPSDADDYLATIQQSVRDVLHYSVVNINDATTTLGGFPYENRFRWYSGSDNDILLNIFVRRVAADPAAIALMQRSYNTTGVLSRPLISLHTLRDQEVPFFHEQIYDLKTFFAGSWLSKHVSFPVDRYGHCNFTPEEALFGFAVMLFYDGVLDVVTGTSSVLTAPELATFERRAQSVGMPTRRSGSKLAFKLKQQ